MSWWVRARITQQGAMREFPVGAIFQGEETPLPLGCLDTL